jgi:hypothetical protein
VWQPDTTSDFDSFAPNRSVWLLLGSIGATAAAMTGVIAAASGAVSIDASPLASVWPVAAAGVVLAAIAIGVAARKPMAAASARSMNGQNVLAMSGVAVALLLSFVFVNRVTEALSPSSVETETATSAYQHNEHPVKSSANSRAELLFCEEDGTGENITAVWMSHPNDI